MISRERRDGPDRLLPWKLGSFFLGAGFLLAGVTTGRDWAVAVAIGVLLVGVVLRLASRHDHRCEAEGEEEL